MSPIRHHTLTFPRVLKGGSIIALAAIAALYVAFQARFLIHGPQVALVNEPNTVQTERQVTLSGVAKNITAIYLNGRPISTDESGLFNESVVLEDGQTIVRIDAVDRFGRHTDVERSFVYQPAHYQ